MSFHFKNPNDDLIVWTWWGCQCRVLHWVSGTSFWQYQQFLILKCSIWVWPCWYWGGWVKQREFTPQVKGEYQFPEPNQRVSLVFPFCSWGCQLPKLSNSLSCWCSLWTSPLWTCSVNLCFRISANTQHSSSSQISLLELGLSGLRWLHWV